MVARVPTQCDQCGKIDTDPKIIYGNLGTWHHDCAPVSVVEAHAEHADWHPHYAAVTEIFRACREDGLKGDKLLAYIQDVSPTHEQNVAFNAKLEKVLAGKTFDDPGAQLAHIRSSLKGGKA
jgi:hypothetical protein